MANECLLTKLKGTVNIDLPIFDAIRLLVKWNGTSSVNLKTDGSNNAYYFGGPGVTIKVLSNGSISVGGVNKGTEYTTQETESGIIAIIPTDNTVDTKIVLKNLSSITRWGSSSGSPYTYLYSGDLFNLPGTNIDGSSIALIGGINSVQDINHLADFPNKNKVTSIYTNINSEYKGDIVVLSQFPALSQVPTALTSKSGLYGNISCMQGNTNVTSITFRRNDKYVGLIDSLSGCTSLISVDVQSTQVTGNIASLGACTNLTSIQCGATSITGTIENLVANFVTAGRTSGSITIGMHRSGITFEGNPVSSGTLTWNGTDNITIS